MERAEIAGSPLSREACLGASLRSEVKGSWVQALCVQLCDFRQVILPLKTLVSQSATGPTHSPCPLGSWDEHTIIIYKKPKHRTYWHKEAMNEQQVSPSASFLPQTTRNTLSGTAGPLCGT